MKNKKKIIVISICFFLVLQLSSYTLLEIPVTPISSQLSMDLSTAGEEIIWSNLIPHTVRTHGLYIFTDVNGDGINELLVHTLQHIWCLDGATGEAIWYEEPEREPEFILILDDVDGDGISDVLYTIRGYGGFKVLSGNGTMSSYVEHESGGPVLWEGYVYEDVIDMAAIEDVNGNGTGDFLLAGIDENLRCGIKCIEGSGQTVIWENNNFSRRIKSLLVHTDHDGDNIDDVLVGTTSYIALLRGKNGTVIWNITAGDGGHLRPFGEINGDSYPEFIGGYSTIIRNGSNGAMLINHSSIYAPTVLTDLTSDGIAEFAVLGAEPDFLSIIDGNTGIELWNRTTPISFHMQSYIQDLNGDGIPEVLCGTCRQDNRMYCLSGNNGSVIWTLKVYYTYDCPPSWRESTCEWLINLGDVTGNGYEDVVTAGFNDLVCIEGNSQGNFTYYLKGYECEPIPSWIYIIMTLLLLMAL